jgi:hypothetical protein
VKRITNGEMLDEPLLDVNVANQKEQGMLGMAIERKELSEKNEELYLSSFTIQKQPRKMVGKL